MAENGSFIITIIINLDHIQTSSKGLFILIRYYYLCQVRQLLGPCLTQTICNVDNLKASKMHHKLM